MKQLEADPWQGIEAKYPVGAKFKGRVTNITDYGAFVELEPGIEGLIHVSEMSGPRRTSTPARSSPPRRRSRCMVLEVDPVKRRISLGLKQTCQPVGAFAEKPIRSARSSRARSRTRPSSACSSASTATSTAWSTSPTSTGTVRASRSIEEYKKGDMVKAQVLDVDVEKERISLGIKQLGGDPFGRRAPATSARARRHLRGHRGQGFRHRREDRRHRPHRLHPRSDLRATASEQRPERFAVGEKVDARVTQFDKKARKVRSRSRRWKIAEEKEASPSTARPTPAPRSATSSAPR
jgi:small subunit ribosomal protein S1